MLPDDYVSRLPLVGFLRRRLHHQIIAPYLLLATIFTVVGTSVLLGSANQSLQQRFNKQLLDAARSSADAFAQAEVQQLTGLRTIIFTEGFPEALARRDSAELTRRIAPQAINYGLDRVIVVGPSAGVLLDLPQVVTGTLDTGSLPASLTSMVKSVTEPAGNNVKVSEVVNTARGYYFFTAGAVEEGGKVIGAVIVGAELPHVLRQVARASLSEIVTFYGPGGALLSHSTATSSSSSNLAAALPQGWYDDVSTRTGAPVRYRTLELASGTYVEALGVVPGRGMSGRPPGVYGAMLNVRTLDARLRDTLWSLLPLYALGLLLIVLIGRATAVQILRPIRQLVAASNEVANGNLDVQVPAAREDELGLLAARFNQMVTGLRQLFHVKDLFGRFVSPEVASRLIEGQIELGGEQRVVTVLFSDLRDFTRLSEEHTAQQLVLLLNDYFHTIVRAAQKYGGTVNRFGGDSTLVVFGAPVDMPDHADRALATALAMQQALDELNARRKSRKPLRQGIGISTGLVVAGQIGSHDRMEYTVIGDTVNVASRMQDLTKESPGCDILMSESTLDALTNPDGWRWRDRGYTEVRGRSVPIRAYCLLGAVRGKQRRKRNRPDPDTYTPTEEVREPVLGGVR